MTNQRTANRSRTAVIRVPQPARRPPFATPPRRGRRGVALVIVLGLLGLLLISAVGFAVLMRTERNAATNYRHTSSARQMLHAALARAIENVNTEIGDDLCPAWSTNRFITVGTRSLQCPENMLFSYYDVSGTGDDPVPARLLTQDILTYIPVLYHRRLTENKYAPPEWSPINYGGSVIGRYAYAVIDTSGLLDAHFVYDPATNRWLGASLAEVRLDPAILTRKDLINKGTFTADRSAHGYYETVAELATLNGGINYSNLANFEVFSQYCTNAAGGVTNFNLFGLTTNLFASRVEITKGFTDSGCNGTAPLSPPLAPLTRENILYAALSDYQDSDSVMDLPYWLMPARRFNRPCTEKLPLLTSYGVVITYTRTALGTNYVHNFKYEPIINFARWPVSESSATDLPFLFKGAICFTNTALDATNSAVAPSGPSANGVCKSAQSTPINNTPSAVAEQNIFLGAAAFNVALTNTTLTPLQPKFDLLVAAEVYNTYNALCYQYPGDKRTNEFSAVLPPNYHMLSPANVAQWAKISVTARPTLPGWTGTAHIQTNWAECVDPRYAYSKDPSSGQWYSYSTGGSAKDMNTIYPLPPVSPARYARKPTPLYVSILTDADLAAKAGLSSNRMDGCYDIAGSGMQYDDLSAQLKMHVANAPLQTVGELGYLLCGPWETVRLYDHFPFDATPDDYHRVLDTFELRDPAAVPNGKVNLNSAPVDVLTLLYLGLPLRSEKAANYLPPDWNPAGTDPARPLTGALAASLAANLHAGLRENGPVRGISDLARIYSTNSVTPQLIKQHLVDISAGGAPGSAFVGEFEREAVIRNIAGLLTVKQQMFTIILRADAFSTRFGSDKLKDGTVLSSATAIAQVYRDAAPPHKVTVRLLKILE